MEGRPYEDKTGKTTSKMQQNPFRMKLNLKCSWLVKYMRVEDELIGDKEFFLNEKAQTEHSAQVKERR